MCVSQAGTEKSKPKDPIFGEKILFILFYHEAIIQGKQSSRTVHTLRIVKSTEGLKYKNDTKKREKISTLRRTKNKKKDSNNKGKKRKEKEKEEDQEKREEESPRYDKTEKRDEKKHKGR